MNALFVFLFFSAIALTRNISQVKYTRFKESDMRLLENVCFSQKEYDIKAMTFVPREKEIHIYTQSFVAKFQAYTDYDLNTFSFLRLIAIEKNDSGASVDFATYDDDGNIIWDRQVYKNITLLIERISDVKVIERKWRNVAFTVKYISRFSGMNNYTHLLLCFNSCLLRKIARIYNGVLHSNTISYTYNELLYLEYRNRYLYSFLFDKTGSVTQWGVYFPFSEKDNLFSIYASFLDKKLFFGCPPSFCTQPLLDALSKDMDARETAHVYYGVWRLKWEIGSRLTSNAIINENEKNAPINVDAVYVDSHLRHKYYIKDDDVSICKKVEWCEGPLSLKRMFSNLRSRVDAAVLVQNFTAIQSYLFLFSGLNVNTYRVNGLTFEFIDETPTYHWIGHESYVNAAAYVNVDNKDQIMLLRLNDVYMETADAIKNHKIMKHNGISNVFSCSRPMTTLMTTVIPTTRTVTAKQTKVTNTEIKSTKFQTTLSTSKYPTRSTIVETSTKVTSETRTEMESTKPQVTLSTKKQRVEFDFWELILALAIVVGVILILMLIFPCIVYCWQCVFGSDYEQEASKPGKSSRKTAKLAEKGKQKKGYSFSFKPLPRKLLREWEEESEKLKERQLQSSMNEISLENIGGPEAHS